MALEEEFQRGALCHRAGQLAEAEKIYRHMAINPAHADALHLLGVLAGQKGRPTEAAELIGRAIAICPANASFHSNLGNALKGSGRLDQAIAAYRRAVEIKPDFAEAFSNLGNALAASGRFDESIAAYRQAIRIKPDKVEAHAGLGTSLMERGRADDAIDSFREAIRLNPGYAEAWGNLGNALAAKNQIDEAISAYRRAIQLKPGFAEAYSNLGNALVAKGQTDEAIASFHQSIRLKPDNAQAHNNLGTALQKRGLLDEAMAAYRRAIALEPAYPEAHCNLGAALTTRGLLDDAIAACGRAVAIQPRYAEAHCGLGNALREAGRLDESLSAYRRAVELKPDDQTFHSTRLYLLHFCPEFSGQEILAEHRQWARRNALPLAAAAPEFGNDRSAGRRLRVGFVSPDFRAHPVGQSLLVFFALRDPKETEIICYSDTLKADELTAKLKSHADGWLEVSSLADAALAEQIRNDRIDLLVDTTLHTAGNRLLVFARGAAPVQLTMLGPPVTTGLSNMHYRLTDRYLDPPGESDDDYTETSIRLPNCFWCYPAPAEAPAVNGLPALANGFVTFGCLNQFSKVTRQVLELWLRILQGVPGSRLVIQAEAGHHLDEVRAHFEEGGISRDRLAFGARTSRRDYFARYHRVDIGLDPFPFNGHTSTMDALWMGVPVVTLRGRTAVGRGGVSILSNCSLNDWIAGDEEQYVATAREMAGDLARLGELRRTLRERMRGSPLMDGEKFARDVEAAFRQMWRQWCETA